MHHTALCIGALHLAFLGHVQPRTCRTMQTSPLRIPGVVRLHIVSGRSSFTHCCKIGAGIEPEYAHTRTPKTEQHGCSRLRARIA
eukprot:11198959-Lingulodinium_polyedra.AAC.1